MGMLRFHTSGDTIFHRLKKMITVNFNLALAKMQNESLKWKNRNLTPFGKITIIKTNLISKVIHLLSVLPTPKSFLKSVNDLLFSFLWDNKPDKIKRANICQDYDQGGMKMIDIYNFEKGLKINWLKRKLLQPNTQWNILFSEMYGTLDNLYKLGGEWATSKRFVNENQFWRSVFESWSEYCKNKLPKNIDH